MENNNNPTSENRGTGKSTKEEIPVNEHDQLEPKPENDLKEKNESGFMKILKKVGFSVWLGVMIIGAGLAFIAALFLL
ncbi:hypothetical protein [Salinimicrobium marinum]|nr:hypothetical protein [Salinimicrobium marinum]